MIDNRVEVLESKVDRIDRIESKVDILDEKLDNTREEVLKLNYNMSEALTSMRNHIQQDEKIITRLLPVIENYEFEQKRKINFKESLIFYGKVITFASTAITLMFLLKNIF